MSQCVPFANLVNTDGCVERVPELRPGELRVLDCTLHPTVAKRYKTHQDDWMKENLRQKTPARACKGRATAGMRAAAKRKTGAAGGAAGTGLACPLAQLIREQLRVGSDDVKNMTGLNVDTEITLQNLAVRIAAKMLANANHGPEASKLSQKALEDLAYGPLPQELDVVGVEAFNIPDDDDRVGLRGQQGLRVAGATPSGCKHLLLPATPPQAAAAAAAAKAVKGRAVVTKAKAKKPGPSAASGGGPAAAGAGLVAVAGAGGREGWLPAASIVCVYRGYVSLEAERDMGLHEPPPSYHDRHLQWEMRVESYCVQDSNTTVGNEKVSLFTDAVGYGNVSALVNDPLLDAMSDDLGIAAAKEKRRLDRQAGRSQATATASGATCSVLSTVVGEGEGEEQGEGEEEKEEEKEVLDWEAKYEAAPTVGKPNCSIQAICVRGWPFLFLVTYHDLPPQQELLYSYGPQYWRMMNKMVRNISIMEKQASAMARVISSSQMPAPTSSYLPSLAGTPPSLAAPSTALALGPDGQLLQQPAHSEMATAGGGGCTVQHAGAGPGAGGQPGPSASYSPRKPPPSRLGEPAPAPPTLPQPMPCASLVVSNAVKPAPAAPCQQAPPGFSGGAQHVEEGEVEEGGAESCLRPLPDEQGQGHGWGRGERLMPPPPAREVQETLRWRPGGSAAPTSGWCQPNQPNQPSQPRPASGTRAPWVQSSQRARDCPPPPPRSLQHQPQQKHPSRYYDTQGRGYSRDRRDVGWQHDQHDRDQSDAGWQRDRRDYGSDYDSGNGGRGSSPERDGRRRDRSSPSREREGERGRREGAGKASSPWADVSSDDDSGAISDGPGAGKDYWDTDSGDESEDEEQCLAAAALRDETLKFKQELMVLFRDLVGYIANKRGATSASLVELSHAVTSWPLMPATGRVCRGQQTQPAAAAKPWRILVNWPHMFQQTSPWRYSLAPQAADAVTVEFSNWFLPALSRYVAKLLNHMKEQRRPRVYPSELTLSSLADSDMAAWIKMYGPNPLYFAASHLLCRDEDGHCMFALNIYPRVASAPLPESHSQVTLTQPRSVTQCTTASEGPGRAQQRSMAAGGVGPLGYDPETEVQVLELSVNGVKLWQQLAVRANNAVRVATGKRELDEAEAKRQCKGAQAMYEPLTCETYIKQGRCRAARDCPCIHVPRGRPAAQASAFASAASEDSTGHAPSQPQHTGGGNGQQSASSTRPWLVQQQARQFNTLGTSAPLGLRHPFS